MPTDRSDGGQSAEARERIMVAAVRCVERDGVRNVSMEGVAAQAGVSRTTLYRHFPGGRGQLVSETATWQVGRFWRRLAEAVADLPTLEDRLVAGLVLGTKLMRRSSILSNLLEPELDELVNALQPTETIVHQVMRDYLTEMLLEEASAGRLRDGVDAREASDYLTRMILSYMGSPAGWDLADEQQTRRLVRTQFLGGIAPAKE
ncbi:MAG TPA: TetR/AcrR family transcriptional regulator [Microthrixaceae bacterium]|nr:TetR/AcrR family transcriptional regulator [Microthrixaceae bacterium]